MTLLLALLLCTPADAAKKPAPAKEPPALSEVAARLVGEALESSQAWDDLVALCDDVGNRLAGTPQLDEAIAWASARMQAEGLTNVHTEPVVVKRWVRGAEHVSMIAPESRALDVLTLGNSQGTPPEGITGDVVVVKDFAELDKLGDAVKGKVVLFDAPFTDYGETVAYRAKGPSEAAKYGAVAALVRSVAPISLATPHTGSLNYEDGVQQIPAAAVTIEDAELMRRMAERGQTPRVRLDLGAHWEDDARSANTIGEVVGREKPDEIVVLGCHLDSWDVGQGAQDDGAGCVAVMSAASLIARLDVHPRRTIRVVLYTNEENGLAGAQAYADAHRAELGRHVAAVECDTGSGQPLGFNLQVATGGTADQDAAALDHAQALLGAIPPLLKPIGADGLKQGHSGADVGRIVGPGVLGLGVDQDMTGYWPIHHTRADTVDKVDPTLLSKNVAAIAVMAYWLAEMPERPLPPPVSAG